MNLTEHYREHLPDLFAIAEKHRDKTRLSYTGGVIFDPDAAPSRRTALADVNMGEAVVVCAIHKAIRQEMDEFTGVLQNPPFGNREDA